MLSTGLVFFPHAITKRAVEATSLSEPSLSLATRDRGGYVSLGT